MRRAIGMLAAWLLLAGGVARGETWTLENDVLRVDLDDATGLFEATVKASGQTWRQQAVESPFTAGVVSRSDNGLTMQLNGEFPAEAAFTLTPENELLVTLTAASGQAMERLAFPAPLVTPSGAHFVVWPESEGVLVPADGSFPKRAGTTSNIYNMSGLIMSWAGVTDPDLKSGYIMIVDTPYDAAVRLVDTAGAVAPQAVWTAEMDAFGYPRAVRYRFLSEGGYVAQAKHYREYLKKHREFRTLREKAETRPMIDKLIGAVQIYTWNDARDLDLARDLKANGIEKAWIGWDPSHPPNPEPGYAEGLKELGYLAGVYDLYRDIYDGKDWEAKAPTDPILSQLIWHRYYYPGIFEDVVAIRPGGAKWEIRFSTDVGMMRYFTCTKAMVPHVGERMDREYKVYPYDSVFLDVTLAAGPIECRSDVHPMTKREDAAARMQIHKIFEEKYGMVVGSEWGADYGVPNTEFMHGLVTLHNYWGSRGTGAPQPATGGERGARGGAPAEEGGTSESGGLAPGELGSAQTSESGDPYDLGFVRGDWNNTQRPTMMLGEMRATDQYREIGLGAQFRVPLFELVHHDCTVSSWRWNDNSHKVPEVWDLKTLYEILYGTAPQWNLDEAMWARHKEKFISTYKTVGPWLEKIGYDEMVNHEYLTADRSVQQTTFSSGAQAIVNFGDAAYEAGDVKVGPMGFMLIGE